MRLYIALRWTTHAAELAIAAGAVTFFWDRETGLAILIAGAVVYSALMFLVCTFGVFFDRLFIREYERGLR